MELHIHHAAAELHPFILEPKALLQSGLAGKQYSAVRSHHPMPGQPVLAAQCPHHLPGSAFESGGLGYTPVGQHLAARYPANNPVDLFEHSRSRLQHQDAVLLETVGAATGESSSSRTLSASISVEKGFCRNGNEWCRPPWTESLSSV